MHNKSRHVPHSFQFHLTVVVVLCFFGWLWRPCFLSPFSSPFPIIRFISIDGCYHHAWMSCSGNACKYFQCTLFSLKRHKLSSTVKKTCWIKWEKKLYIRWWSKGRKRVAWKTSNNNNTNGRPALLCTWLVVYLRKWYLLLLSWKCFCNVDTLTHPHTAAKREREGVKSITCHKASTRNSFLRHASPSALVLHTSFVFWGRHENGK